VIMSKFLGHCPQDTPQSPSVELLRPLGDLLWRGDSIGSQNRIGTEESPSVSALVI
jgi:hypothetical protein